MSHSIPFDPHLSNPVRYSEILNNDVSGKEHAKTQKSPRITMLQVPTISKEIAPTRIKFKSPDSTAPLSQVVTEINMLVKATSVYNELSLNDGKEATVASAVNSLAYKKRAHTYSKLSEEADELAKAMKKALGKVYGSFDDLISEPRAKSRKILYV